MSTRQTMLVTIFACLAAACTGGSPTDGRDGDASGDRDEVISGDVRDRSEDADIISDSDTDSEHGMENDRHDIDGDVRNDTDLPFADDDGAYFPESDLPQNDDDTNDSDTAPAAGMNFCLHGTYDPDTDNPGSGGDTYFIRTDGGDETQCTGMTDAPYPGTGTGRDCAWRHPFVAFPPDGTPRINGGDTLIIGNGSYRMGFGASSGSGQCAEEYPWDCHMSPVPSGPDKDHPTRIFGEEWDTGCPDPPELYGAERALMVMNLRGSDNVHLNCLEITDRETCGVFHCHGGVCPEDTVHACAREEYPFGVYADTGLYAVDSEHVTIENLDIHGLADKGIHAGRLRDWNMRNVRIAGNSFVGWDGDVGPGNSSNTGTIDFTCVSVIFNGCIETEDGDFTGCWGQTAGGYGDGLGTNDTAGEWRFFNSEFSHNTSDGIDLLYHNLGGSVTIDSVRAEGNAGNQIKTRGDSLIVNTVVVGRCTFFEGREFTAHVDHCRALGDAVMLDYTPGAEMIVVNSTIYGEGNILVTAGSAGEPDGTERFISRNTIFRGDTCYFHPERSTALFYNDGVTGLDFDDTDYSVFFNVHDNSDSPPALHNIRDDPLIGPFTGTPLSFDMIPGEESPAIDSGTSEGTYIPEYDIRGKERHSGSGIDIGAFEVRQ